MATSRLRIKAWGWLLGFGLVLTGAGQAERLPMKIYTTADGLPSDSIHRIVRDSRGYLWFCTADGLSRFDGYQFTNYTTEQGLPHHSVWDLLETPPGTYWVATTNGLCRFDPVAKSKFTVYRPAESGGAASFRTLLKDRTGTIWCGTWSGLYRLVEVRGQWTLQWVDLGLAKHAPVVLALLEDRRGALWIGADQALYRRWPDGRLERYATEQGLLFDIAAGIYSLLEDRSGSLWVGTRSGLYRLVPEPDPQRPVVARRYTTKNGLPGYDIWSLFQTAEGKLWLGLHGGLLEYIPSSEKAAESFRSYTEANGLSSYDIWALAEDRDGNLWVGSVSGAMKMARQGFITYTEGDGLPSNYLNSIFENQAGELCVIAWKSGRKALCRFDGRKFTALMPALPPPITTGGWGSPQTTFQDRQGEWWVATGQGLCRFPKLETFEQLAHTRPKQIYTTRDGLPGDVILHLYEDARGDVWISTWGGTGGGLSRWERATEILHTYALIQELPGLSDPVVSSFIEDGVGHLWLGFDKGGLARYHDGRFTVFTAAEGVPDGSTGPLYRDQAGRLWIASSTGGLGRIDDPTAERPPILRYTTAHGLASNQIVCITEDRWGHLYLGTGRGLDRLDPATGRVNKHYTTADGLAESLQSYAFRDRHGALWFGTLKGLSRLIPEPDRRPAPPSVLIRSLRIAGDLHPISDLGETAVSGLELEPQRNSLQIDCVGLGFGAGEALRYQYKLEGADRDWSAPSDQRTIHYARLSPGTYRFLVQAINTDGVSSPVPAAVSFTILRPVWQRGWFLMLVGLAAGLMLYALYRSRMARLLALERVRTRIATDLHDDIGSSLSRMAVLSELIRRKIGASHPESGALALNVAETARGLMEAMGDIVWSIDPRRDDLSNLILRIRQFAVDTLEAQDIVWDFQAPPEPEKVKLTPEQRRHVYLIVKEAIHNIVRHAQATSVRLTLRVTRQQLLAEVQDNGRGFAVPSTPDPCKRGRSGYGLGSMRARAAELGGSLQIESQPGQGTRLLLRIPLS